MARRGKLKIKSILEAINVLILLIIISFYGCRFIKYYNKENTSNSGDVTLLKNELISKVSVLDLSKGLIENKENNTYTFKGNTSDNYLLYSGILFRIIGIDESGNIKAITDNSITNMYSGLENTYSKSYVNKWLNTQEDVNHSGIFQDNLYKVEELTTNSTLCTDVVSDLEKITCDNKTNDTYFGLLSLYEYKEAGGKNSYLNNGETYYLINLDDKNENYYVTSDGEVGLNSVSTRMYGVRPIITFRNDTELLSGKGTKSNPYIVEKHEVTTLNQTSLYDYVKLDDVLYKVIYVNESYVKLASNSPLKNKDEEITIKYGSNNKYSSSSTIGKYLNNDFYNSLSFKEDIIDASWFVGDLSLMNLDYTSVYSSKSKAKIGLLTLGDVDLFGVKGVFTSLKNFESSSIINVITKDGNLYGDNVSSKYMVRPSFYLKGTLEIKSGDGSINNPYELGGTNEEK